MGGVAGKGGGSALSKIQVICYGAPPADAVLYKASQMGKVTTLAVANDYSFHAARGSHLEHGVSGQTSAAGFIGGWEGRGGCTQFYAWP